MKSDNWGNLKNRLKRFWRPGDEVICTRIFRRSNNDCYLCDNSPIEWHHVLLNSISNQTIDVEFSCVINIKKILEEWGSNQKILFFNKYAEEASHLNDSVREIHILYMFSIFNCIRYQHLGKDIKNSIIDYIIDSYIDFLVLYTREKGIDEETLFMEAESLKKLIIKRFTQYTEILKKYETEALKNDSTGGSCKEFEIGNDLIKVLNNITSHEYDDEDVYQSVYFLSFFVRLITDKHINDLINSDAIELHPKDAKAYLTQGATYLILGKYNKAIKHFDKAIELDPKYSRAYYHRGLAYDSLENYNLSIKDYDMAIDLNPKYVEAYNNRGLAYDSLGNYKQAIKDYDRAIR